MFDSLRDPFSLPVRVLIVKFYLGSHSFFAEGKWDQEDSWINLRDTTHFFFLWSLCIVYMIYCVFVPGCICLGNSVWPLSLGPWFQSPRSALHWKQEAHLSCMGLGEWAKPCWAVERALGCSWLFIRSELGDLRRVHMLISNQIWVTSVGCWYAGFLSDVKQPRMHHLKEPASMTCRARSSTWDQKLLGRMGSSGSGEAMTSVLESFPRVLRFWLVSWLLMPCRSLSFACPLDQDPWSSGHLCCCLQPDIWALSWNSGCQELCTSGWEDSFRSISLQY